MKIAILSVIVAATAIKVGTPKLIDKIIRVQNGE